MPSAHRRYAGWTVEKIDAETLAIGPNASLLCTLIRETKHHPEQGYRACLGIVRLPRLYGRERVEAACERALAIGAKSYGSVKSILDNRLDQRPITNAAADGPPILHPNIRGGRYYQ
jgi:transposase